jgi:hypothetical protein
MEAYPHKNPCKLQEYKIKTPPGMSSKPLSGVETVETREAVFAPRESGVEPARRLRAIFLPFHQPVEANVCNQKPKNDASRSDD